MFSAYLDKIPACILVTILLAPCAAAQETSAIPARLIIPDQTPVKLQLTESISSAHARSGDRLDFIVARDVNIEGFTVIPAGTVASGSVTGVKGKRLLGIGGNVALKLDSVELANGDRVALHARLNVKGRSRTKLMAAGMIATGLVFLPATPVLLLTRGHDSTVLKSTEITAHIDAATSVLSTGLQHSQERSSELDTMMDYLPPRVFNAEGREGDMLNLVLVGQEEDLQNAFERAGWVKTDKWKTDLRLALVVAWNPRCNDTNGQVLSVRKSAGLLVCLARAGCSGFAASSSSNLENRSHDRWDARLGGFGHP